MNDSWKQVTNAVELFSLPDVYFKLKTILADPGYSMAKVAVVISQDPAITLRLLRIVNSSYYGLRTKVETVDRAITLLGTDQVHDLVLTTSVTQSFKGLVTKVMDMEKFWRSSVSCAIISRLLAYATEGCNGERLFVAGLLHDIGHLVMYQTLPQLCLEALETAKENKEPVYKTERFFIGFDYAKAGSVIMESWGLPKSLTETTQFHVEPEKAEKYQLETALIHISSLLCKSDENTPFNEDALTVGQLAWNLTKLNPEQCIEIKHDAENEINAVMNLIFK
jgi:HD-like signal output (HDOD) protein